MTFKSYRERYKVRDDVCGEGRDFVLSQWRKDLRTGILAILIMVLAVSPWALFGAVCARRQAEQTVTAMTEVEQPCVAITFDDGPRRETTTLLLDGLAQRGAHATFFLVGERIEGNEDVILRMEREGHQVGIHSQSHMVLAELNTQQLYAEVEVLSQTLNGLLGERTFMLRPPYGLISDNLCKWVKHPVILWSVDPEDWSDHDVERQVAQVMAQIKDGDIILLHDIYYASVETALQIVDGLLAQGFLFVTVEELFALRKTEPEAGTVYRSLPPGED